MGHVGSSSEGDALPNGWRELRTPDGKVYYNHMTTKTTQWTRPTIEAVELPLQDGWREVHTPDGKVYYFHAATQMTQWTRPASDALERSTRLSRIGTHFSAARSPSSASKK